MNNRSIVAAVVILGLIIVGMFVFANLKKAEIAEEDRASATTTEDQDAAYAGITTIDAKHFIEGNNHTIAGEILMPTPCDLLDWDVRVQESMPETAIIDFTVVNNAETCIQVVTPQRFLVTFEASPEASVRATLQDRSVELNLIPPSPGETPEDFELFIKG